MKEKNCLQEDALARGEREVNVDLIVHRSSVWTHIGAAHGAKQDDLLIVWHHIGQPRLGRDLRQQQATRVWHHGADLGVPLVAAVEEEVLPRTGCKEIWIGLTWPEARSLQSFERFDPIYMALYLSYTQI